MRGQPVCAIAVGFLAAWCLAVPARAGAGIERFPWLKDLKVLQSPGGEPCAAALDEEIFAETDDAYSNVRLLDSDGAEVPYLQTVANKTRVFERTIEVPVKILDFRLFPDNRCQVVFERTDRERELAVSEIIIRSPLRNFEKDVAVDGSDDRDAWIELARDSAVFDYSRFLDLNNSTVKVTPGTQRYFRMTISNLSEERRAPLRQIVRETHGGQAVRETETTTLNREDFRVERILAFGMKTDEAVREPETREYGAGPVQVSMDSTNKSTIVRFSSNRAPVTEVGLVIKGSQFSRSARLDASNDPAGEDGWRTVASATLARIDLARTRVDCVAFKMSPVRCRHFRVVIANGDSPALDVTGVELKGEAREILFFGSGSGAYRIAYGGESGVLPEYDIARVLGAPPYRPGTRYVAGNRYSNPGFRKGAAPRAGGGRWLMMTGVGAMVAFLVWAIARAARRIDLKTE
jgi:hypothetical protein